MKKADKGARGLFTKRRKFGGIEHLYNALTGIWIATDKVKENFIGMENVNTETIPIDNDTPFKGGESGGGGAERSFDSNTSADSVSDDCGCNSVGDGGGD